MPHYPLASSTEGIYQSFQIGRVLFLLTDSRFAKSPRRDSDPAGKTVLGTNQKTWLKSELLRGKDLDLIVWASSIPWIGEEDPSEDYWAGYTAERAELCQHLVDHDIRNVCMISADAHMVAIDDGSHSGYAAGGRGGFPVFQAAALESSESEKGGPYSIGDEHGQTGPGIAGSRQFGVFEIDYSAGAGPVVKWTGFRAEKGTTTVTPLMRHEFPARRDVCRVLSDARCARRGARVRVRVRCGYRLSVSDSSIHCSICFHTSDRSDPLWPAPGTRIKRFGPRQRRVDTLGVRRRRFDVVGAVDDEDGRGDSPRRLLRLHVVDAKVPLRAGDVEGAVDHAAGEEARRALGRDRAQIRKRLRGDDRADAGIVRRFLQRDRGAQRRPDQNDRSGRQRVDHAMEILLLEEAVGARVALRVAVRAAVVGDHIESARDEALDHAGGAAAIVGDAVEIDDRAARGSGGCASPAFQRHAGAGEVARHTVLRGRQRRDVTGRVKEPAGAQRWKLPPEPSQPDQPHQAHRADRRR